MKNAIILTLATSAAATALKAKHVDTSRGTAPSTSSSGSFALRAYTNDTTLNGCYATEMHSTNDGSTTVILGPQNQTAPNSLKMDGMFLLGGNLAVGQPVRAGGSEYDYMNVGSVDNTTGLATALVVPAGFQTGWYVKNATANQTRASHVHNSAFRGRNAEAALMTVLGYTDATSGQEASMVACPEVNGTSAVAVQQIMLAYGQNASQPTGLCKPIELEVVYDGSE